MSSPPLTHCTSWLLFPVFTLPEAFSSWSHSSLIAGCRSCLLSLRIDTDEGMSCRRRLPFCSHQVAEYPRTAWGSPLHRGCESKEGESRRLRRGIEAVENPALKLRRGAGDLGVPSPALGSAAAGLSASHGLCFLHLLRMGRIQSVSFLLLLLLFLMFSLLFPIRHGRETEPESKVGLQA